jgi:methylated-DNA-[protein]-cysteine S-methyltransferase
MKTDVIAHASFDSPLGTIRLARTARGLAGLWFVGQKHEPLPFGGAEARNDPLLAQAAAQFNAYVNGQRDDFDVPLDPQGTPFQQRVWKALRRIGRGRTQSYGEVARAVGSPAAVRAVGAAVGRNPLSVILPCPRVLGSNGALTGYAGGLDRKRRLLRVEGVDAA